MIELVHVAGCSFLAQHTSMLHGSIQFRTAAEHTIGVGVVVTLKPQTRQARVTHAHSRTITSYETLPFRFFVTHSPLVCRSCLHRPLPHRSTQWPPTGGHPGAPPVLPTPSWGGSPTPPRSDHRWRETNESESENPSKVGTFYRNLQTYARSRIEDTNTHLCKRVGVCVVVLVRLSTGSHG